MEICDTNDGFCKWKLATRIRSICKWKLVTQIIAFVNGNSRRESDRFVNGNPRRKWILFRILICKWNIVTQPRVHKMRSRCRVSAKRIIHSVFGSFQCDFPLQSETQIWKKSRLRRESTTRCRDTNGRIQFASPNCIQHHKTKRGSTNKDWEWLSSLQEL